jgi:hypothetical protein
MPNRPAGASRFPEPAAQLLRIQAETTVIDLAPKEIPVRKTIMVAGLSTLLLLSVPSSFAAGAPAAKSGAATIVIVFKDGHRQTFKLSDIERVEFPGGGAVASESNSPAGQMTPRGVYFGKWEVGDGGNGTFIITLKENGEAHRTLNESDGHWSYVNGEAQITWNDGAMDAIRKVGSKFRKYAYSAGKSFNDHPDNEGEARNTSPRPI